MDKIKILCAENHEPTRLIIKTKMEAKGWEVIEAKDGVEAFAKYKQCEPDLIILDVDVPKQPKCLGLEVLKLIRLNDLFIPIVIYSSSTDNKDIKSGYENGATVYFTKNYSIDNLLLQVKSLLPDKIAHVDSLAFGITYNFISNELRINDRCKTLTGLENRVFTMLCRNRNQGCKRKLLLEAGWNSTDAKFEVQLSKMIGKLRQMLKGTDKVKIILDRGNGYCLTTK